MKVCYKQLIGKRIYIMSEIITKNDIESILNMKVPSFVSKRLEENPLKYENLSNKQLNDYLINVIKVLIGDIKKSGKHRLAEWESGWEENLNEFKETKNFNLLIPKYHSKNRYVRWKQNIVNPLSKTFDYDIHIAFVDTILNNYLEGIENVYEFGAGPAYHLLRLQKQFPNLNFCGLDWTKTSQEIIKEINNIFGTEIDGHRFDFFEPDNLFKIKPNSLIYSVAALEQVGDRYKDYINYLIEQKPAICIHMEPMAEFLDETNLIDYLSIEYFRKRNYLCGFMDYLKTLEALNKIEIVNTKRLYTGSYFIEGHSMIAWRVK